MIRYADDFLVVAKTPFELPGIRERVEAVLGALGLELSAEKTRFTSFEEHFQFLGAEMHGRKILLPFEKEKIAKNAMDAACAMPHALRREYRAKVRACGGRLAEAYPPFGATSLRHATGDSIPNQELNPGPKAVNLLDELRHVPV
jgi:hypothetical protein